MLYTRCSIDITFPSEKIYACAFQVLHVAKKMVIIYVIQDKK